MVFYLGTHQADWLANAGVPLFVSRRRLARREQHWRPARARWALDSGGFSELSMFGEWRTTPRQYAAEAVRWKDQIGRLDWAAIQDWMCEPFMLAKTKRTVRQHQAATILSLKRLQDLAPDVPWAPVIQGWTLADFQRHADAYERAGVNLAACRIVGVGSICRRQATAEAAQIIRALAARGIRIHAFGFKVQGIRAVRRDLASADSMAWSYQARKRARLEGCRHHFCSNCILYALQWRRSIVRPPRPRAEAAPAAR